MKSSKRTFLLGLKVGTLERVIKKRFKFKFFPRKDSDEAGVTEDLKWFPEEVVDYLMMVELVDLKTFIHDVNIWVQMEEKVAGIEIGRYKAGGAKELFKKMEEAKKK